MTPLSRSFCSLAILAAAAWAKKHPRPQSENFPVQNFRSFDFIATTVASNRSAQTPPAPGLLFVEPHESSHQGISAPYIISDNGTLVWRATNGAVGVNLDVQDVNGTNYLTYWTGESADNNGYGYGSVAFLDHTYTQKYNVCVSDLTVNKVPGIKVYSPCLLDLHESRVTSRGTLLATLRNITTTDLTAYGGPNPGYVLDSVFLEIDIKTNEVLFRWSPLDHLDQLDFLKLSLVHPAEETGQSPETAWDYFHMNSISDVPEPMGGYITSSRLLAAPIKLDSEGNVEWYLQGVDGGNFSLPADATFEFQHDVTPFNVEATSLSISMFDNANRNGEEHLGPSSGLELYVDVANFKASLIRRLSPPANNIAAPGGVATLNATIESPATGSYQRLSNGHALVCYGEPPLLNEFDSAGTLIYSGLLAAPNGGSYRGYRIDGWVGQPAADPAVVSLYDAATGTTTVYASWNGATEVAHWAVMTEGREEAVMTVVQDGFETEIVLAGWYENVHVLAMDGGGSVLKQSPPYITLLAENGNGRRR